MSATLGGLLKDYRLQKNISQLEISFAVGWKEPSRLSRIEQGHVGRPKRELLSKIMDAMKLSEEERGRLLLAGGYVPTEEEIAKVRKQTKNMINKWSHPAFIYDFTWRIIDMNIHARKVYKISSKQYKQIYNSHPWLTEVLFDENFSQNKQLKGKDKDTWEAYLFNHVSRFIHAHKQATKEKWYIELMSKLMNNTKFREIWQKAQSQSIMEGVANFGTVRSIVNPKDSSKRLNFHYTILSLINNPLFEIEYEIPADLDTFKYFEN